MIDFLKIITNKDKPPVNKKWQEVYSIMAVHTQGAMPEELFKQRRPLESDNKAILEYRKENHRPVTKDEFDKAMSDYISTANNLDFTINYGNSKVKDYEQKIKLNDGLKKLNLKQWIFSKIGAYSQTDPNALIIFLPKHPTEDLIPDYNFELPNFDNIKNQNIGVDVKLIISKNVIASTPEYVVFKAGKYRYSTDEYGDYYFAITPEQTYIVLPKKEKDTLVYVQLPYYKNNLKYLPALVIGNKLIIEQLEDGSTLEYYVSDYYGAAAWGDLAVGQGSDLRVCEVRYVYPRHWRIKVKCDNDENYCHYEGGKYVVNDGSTCSRCNGTGYIMDTSPMGTMMIDKGGILFGSDGKLQEPEGFITPPTEILKHGAEREAFYFEQMRNSLCIMSQNMTNQSAASKSYDVSHKVDLVTRIITNLLIIYENSLNIIDQYIGGSGEVTITPPEDFDVRNTEDLLIQLSESKKSGAPYITVVELTKRYMIKTFGNDKINEFIVNYLSKTDKLFGYGLDDLQKVKAIFGSDITQKEILIHTLGYQILKALFDEGILTTESNNIAQLLDNEVNKYIQPTLV